MDNEHYIILFDGVCNFCNSSVNFVMDRDHRKKFKFGALQSEQGQALLQHYSLEVPQDYDSVLLLKNKRLFKKSSAALQIARELNGLWPLLYLFIIFPPFMRDWIYDLIARNRYRWFGKSETCRLPEPGLKDRFL